MRKCSRRRRRLTPKQLLARARKLLKKPAFKRALARNQKQSQPLRDAIRRSANIQPEDRMRIIGMSGFIPLKDWDKLMPRLIAQIRKSERLTGKDLMVTINARDY